MEFIHLKRVEQDKALVVFLPFVLCLSLWIVTINLMFLVIAKMSCFVLHLLISPACWTSTLLDFIFDCFNMKCPMEVSFYSSWFFFCHHCYLFHLALVYPVFTLGFLFLDKSIILLFYFFGSESYLLDAVACSCPLGLSISLFSSFLLVLSLIEK